MYIYIYIFKYNIYIYRIILHDDHMRLPRDDKSKPHVIAPIRQPAGCFKEVVTGLKMAP